MPSILRLTGKFHILWMCRIAGGLLQLLKEMLYILGNALIQFFVLIVTKKQKNILFIMKLQPGDG